MKRITATFLLGGAGIAAATLGLLVDKATLERIFTGFSTLFNNALKAAPTDWQRVAMVVPSSGAGNHYGWLERFPRLRKWIGEKFIKALKAGHYYKANEDWETTIAVDRNDIEDDQLGIYNAQAQMAGDAAGELEQIIVDDLRANSFTATGIDGQYFYDTDHPVGDTTASNKGTAALSAATQAAVAASYGLARIAIMALTDSEGMSLRLVPNLLEVGPAQEVVARIICEADKLVDNSPNPYRGTAAVYVNPAISDNSWFLHVTNKGSLRPYIIQMRKAPVLVPQVSMENDDVFMKREYKYGAEARATGIYGFWQLSYGSTGAA